MDCDDGRDGDPAPERASRTRREYRVLWISALVAFGVVTLGCGGITWASLRRLAIERRQAAEWEEAVDRARQHGAERAQLKSTPRGPEFKRGGLERMVVGKAEAEVRGRLGPPEAVTVREGWVEWEYSNPDANRFADEWERAVVRLEDGKVVRVYFP